MTALLLSNSQQPGQDVFEHAKPWIKDLFTEHSTVMYVPYGVAEVTDDPYEGDVTRVLESMGYKVINARKVDDPIKALDKVDGVLIGGGNTFRLLKELQDTGMLDAIREKVKAGMPFMGASAGTNAACPTIQNTNDMPIACPDGFGALGIIDHQINTHYLDDAPQLKKTGVAGIFERLSSTVADLIDPREKHMGESRSMRLEEFHEQKENTASVLGIREGAAILVSNDGTETLLGEKSARYFRQGHEPVELQPGILDLN